MREIVGFVINGIGICFNLTKSFVLDRIGTLNITYFHYLVFAIFITVTIRVISFIKGIQEIQTEQQAEFDRQQKTAYNEWLRDHPSTPRRFKR